MNDQRRTSEKITVEALIEMLQGELKDSVMIMTTNHTSNGRTIYIVPDVKTFKSMIGATMERTNYKEWSEDLRELIDSM